MEKKKVHTTVKGNRVVFQRFFDSPRERVFAAWASPEHLAKWWGPTGFTLTTQSLDFTNGGTWNFIMHGPDGRDYRNRIHFIEIRKPESILYNQSGAGETEGIRFLTLVSFKETGGGTDLKIETEFPSQEALERVAREYGAIEGGEQHLNRLGEFIDSLKLGQQL
ncbi:MAG: SRPBCC domain-containing protein [Leptospirales bacterium]